MKRYLLTLLLALTVLWAGCGDTTPDIMPPTVDTSADTTDGQEPASCVAHTDVNDDGNCDDCGLYVIVCVDFYAINDLHGKFCDTDAQPGVDELTTYLKNARKTDDNVIFLASGDMWQGSSESNLTKGLILTDWMNELDFSAMTLGNHE